MEDWYGVLRWPEYLISNHGRVYSIRSDRILATSRGSSGKGYQQVKLWRNNKEHTISVHILVAERFCPGWFPGAEVNHKDGNKDNNHESNLEWETPSGNMLHSFAIGRKPSGGPHKIRPVRIIETGETFETLKACATHIGGDSSAIHRNINGNGYKVRGYTFEYAD